MNVDDESNESYESEDEEVTPQINVDESNESNESEDEEVTPQINSSSSEYETDEDENPIAEPELEGESSAPQIETPQTTIVESPVGSPPEEQGLRTIVRKRKTAPTSSTPPIAKHIRF
jgi:hypothetical protein